MWRSHGVGCHEGFVHFMGESPYSYNNNNNTKTNNMCGGAMGSAAKKYSYSLWAKVHIRTIIICVAEPWGRLPRIIRTVYGRKIIFVQ